MRRCPNKFKGLQCQGGSITTTASGQQFPCRSHVYTINNKFGFRLIEWGSYVKYDKKRPNHRIKFHG